MEGGRVKNKIVIVLAAVVLVLSAVLYLRFGGVTHERIVGVVETESAAIQDVVEEESVRTRVQVNARADALEGKLDALNRKFGSIETKLDRLLQIADRPLPDGLQEVR